jgi:Rieske Fe-S protein
VAEERPEQPPGNGPSQPYRGPRAHDPEPPGPRPEDDPAYVTRTRFLSLGAIAGGAAITAAIIVPVIGFAVTPTLEPEPEQWIDVGPLRDFPDGATTSIAMSGPDPEADRRVFVRRRDDTIVPIWNRCAHLGCPVGYSPGGDVYACPCHGGAYDSLGLVTAGPPPRPLDRFSYKVVRPDPGGEGAADVALADARDTDRLLIGRPYSINEDQEPYALHGPGEPVTGVLSNLYPTIGS